MFDGCNWRRVAAHQVSHSGNAFALAMVPIVMVMVVATGMMGVLRKW